MRPKFGVTMQSSKRQIALGNWVLARLRAVTLTGLALQAAALVRTPHTTAIESAISITHLRRAHLPVALGIGHRTPVVGNRTSKPAAKTLAARTTVEAKRTLRKTATLQDATTCFARPLTLLAIVAPSAANLLGTPPPRHLAPAAATSAQRLKGLRPLFDRASAYAVVSWRRWGFAAVHYLLMAAWRRRVHPLDKQPCRLKHRRRRKPQASRPLKRLVMPSAALIESRMPTELVVQHSATMAVVVSGAAPNGSRAPARVFARHRRTTRVAVTAAVHHTPKM